ncbi:shewanella-like protein phosphatase 2 [Andrographis paniculata]|uniref:shewanella-like protein phosphatase 2 n=1 Tax=Andrographis paniculata TaxID=175694 RepID=UPI0021E9931C|nr:shewanella-like protein phosphatase 2 [Andrographis paniculata]
MAEHLGSGNHTPSLTESLTSRGVASAIDCGDLPSIVSSFVDTFVDFSVSGGLFLPPEPESIENSKGELRTVFPQPSRLIAIGDIHGDLRKAKEALLLANLIGPGDRWCGGSATVVQVGDILDRGGDEIKLLYFFEKLKREAAKAGGQVITLNGNHEIMNVDGDFRYATPSGLKEFENWLMWQRVGNAMKKMCNGIDGNTISRDLLDGVPDEIPGVRPDFLNAARARFAALRPNGLVATRFLSKNQTVVVVGDSVFAHGGLLQKHVVHGFDRINEEVRDWILGVNKRVANYLVRGRSSIVWMRSFSNEQAKDCDCSMLEHVLETIPGVKRLIMGHTIQQEGINAVCANRAIRIDVGMSKECGNKFPEVLEINENSELRVLTSNPTYWKGYHAYVNRGKKDGLGLLTPETGSRQIKVNS